MASPAYSWNAVHGGIPTTSWSITLPATAANDILVLASFNRGATTAPTLGGTYTGGAWTDFGNAGALRLFWSRATGNHTTETVTGSGLTDSCSAGIMGVTGCITTQSPIDSDTEYRQDSASPDVNTLNAIVTTAADTLIVLATGGTDDVAAMSSATKDDGGTAMTVRVDKGSSGGNDSYVGMATVAQTAAGSTGGFNFTQDLGAGDAKDIFAFALLSVAGGTDATVVSPAASVASSAPVSVPALTLTAPVASVASSAPAPGSQAVNLALISVGPPRSEARGVRQYVPHG